jgi:Spy/CpxP family protein refolding chaperone
MRNSILLAALTLLAAFGMVNAQPEGMGKGMGMNGMHGMMVEKLKLTDQQQEKFQDLMIQHQKDMIPKQADLRLAKIGLKEIMMKSDIDENAALDQMDKISAIKAQISKLRLQHLLAARKILTADQLKEFKAMHQEMGFGRHGRKFGHMGGPMMGRGMGPGMGAGMDKGIGDKMGWGMHHEEGKGDDKEKSEEKK